MLRPLWLTENYPPDRGGMAQSCDRIVRALRSRGVAIDLVHLSRRTTSWRTEIKMRGRQITGPLSEDPSHTLNQLWSLLSREGAPRPTHVVAFGGTIPLLAGPPFAAWLDLPLVTLIRGNDFDTAVFSPKKSDVLRTALRASQRVCTVTRDHASRASALEPSATVDWIPNGVDAESWRVLPHDQDAASRWRQQNVAPGRRVLGVFGQLKQKKGVLFLLDVLQRSGRSSAVHLLLVGDLDEALLAFLDQQRDAIAFTVLPFRDRLDLLPLYAACDAIAVPSFYDGLPNVVLEAAALGIPLLASNAGGMPDVLDEQRSILFQSGDEHDCRRAIERFVYIEESDLRALGQRARQHVLRDFTVDQEAERCLEVLRTSLRSIPGISSLGGTP